MPYRVDFPQADQAALLRLLDLGALDADLQDGGRGAAVMPDGVTPEQVRDALGVPRVTVTAAVGRDADSVWVLRPRPLRLGRLRLVPDAEDHGAPEPGDIRLADTAAFGTGLHATTALCVAILDELVAHRTIDAVLDVGCGTGVLALAALRLGVPRAVAIDLDLAAVRATVDNAARNDVRGRLYVIQGGPEALSGRWPVVLANVLAAPLIEMAPTVAACVGRGGRLVLSGIGVALQDDVARAYRRVGLHVVEVRRRHGWAAIVLSASW